MQRIQFF